MNTTSEHQRRWFKRPWFRVSAVVFLVAVVAFAASDSVRFFVCSAAQFCIYGMPEKEDFAQAQVIMDTITGVHHFAQKSISQPATPPVFSNPGSRMILTQPTVVDVYEIEDPIEQDRVIAAVKAVVCDRKFRPVDLRFFAHENWTANGEMRGRGPELQLRRVRIAQNGVQEEGGQKTITYPVP